MRVKHRRTRPRIGQQLTADQYLEHWKARQIWMHNTNEKHALRFDFCASNAVGETFADVGCLLGHSTAQLKEKHPGAWTGIDFTLAAIEEAGALFPDITFKFVEHPEMLNTLGQFDSVICSEVLEHVPDDAELVRGLVGIARWRVLMTTPNHDAGDPGHVRQYTDESMRTLLAPYGGQFTADKWFFYAVIDKGGI